MSSFGETLRNAREAKGLTCSQVAAQTHMLVQIVEEMEREDFHRIPAPIYGRGFVRLFADCVGLDPIPLVREFMDIYEGRRAPTVSIREVPSAPIPPPIKPDWSSPDPEPAAAPVPEPVPAPEPEPAFVLPTPEPAFVPPTPEPAFVPPTPDPAPVPPPEPEASAVPEPESQFAPLPDSEFAPLPEFGFEPPSEPEPVPEPVPEPIPEPIPEPPQVTRGLELFEQPPTRTATDDLPLFAARPTPAQKPVPEPAAPARTETVRDASPFLTGYDEEPSATERFKNGISAVSTSILKKVRGIPRRAWRMTFLLLCAAVAILFIVWSIGKLYSDTAASAPAPAKTAVPAAPAEQPAPAPRAPAPAPNLQKQKPATPPAKSGTLISTGQDIPNLYVD